ncbi:unnamed protein product [Closterium sp. NIES-65]|nr:unnamed protein product [Closterium sp. NIES-65]
MSEDPWDLTFMYRCTLVGPMFPLPAPCFPCLPHVSPACPMFPLPAPCFPCLPHVSPACPMFPLPAPCPMFPPSAPVFPLAGPLFSPSCPLFPPANPLLMFPRLGYECIAAHSSMESAHQQRNHSARILLLTFACHILFSHPTLPFQGAKVSASLQTAAYGVLTNKGTWCLTTLLLTFATHILFSLPPLPFQYWVCIAAHSNVRSAHQQRDLPSRTLLLTFATHILFSLPPLPFQGAVVSASLRTTVLGGECIAGHLSVWSAKIRLACQLGSLNRLVSLDPLAIRAALLAGLPLAANPAWWVHCTLHR